MDPRIQAVALAVPSDGDLHVAGYEDGRAALRLNDERMLLRAAWRLPCYSDRRR